MCRARVRLDAMIREGVDVALVARISCGIYAGSDFRKKINGDFLDLVNEILRETLEPKETRGNHFQSVVVPMIATVATKTTRFV